MSREPASRRDLGTLPDILADKELVIVLEHAAKGRRFLAKASSLDQIVTTILPICPLASR